MLAKMADDPSGKRNFIVDCNGSTKTDRDRETEVGKLNLLCDTLRGRLRLNRRSTLFSDASKTLDLELFHPLGNPTRKTEKESFK